MYTIWYCVKEYCLRFCCEILTKRLNFMLKFPLKCVACNIQSAEYMTILAICSICLIFYISTYPISWQSHHEFALYIENDIFCIIGTVCDTRRFTKVWLPSVFILNIVRDRGHHNGLTTLLLYLERCTTLWVSQRIEYIIFYF